MRQWFNHESEKWNEFKARYFAELDEDRQVLRQLLKAAKEDSLTLVYVSRDKEHSQAVALREYLEKLMAWLNTGD